ncbi:MAG: DUF45 domain-containing protein [Alistipes sp.]|nr:DUF45 domain-containing protein [Alistipes sp.]
MSRIDYFELGRDYYSKGYYQDATACFIRSILEDYCNASRAWLGSCYEYGLGFEKDLVLAKDLYATCYNHLGHYEVNNQFGIWVTERLNTLKDIVECDCSSKFIDGIGNVKVVKNRNISQTPRFRYNINEIVATIDKRDSIVEGFYYVEKHIPQINKAWTCDGHTRYFDGYTIHADLFSLDVRRGQTNQYISRIDGQKCSLLFPKHVNLEYIYVQETIHQKVKNLLFQRAQHAIPPILKMVSERVNVPYGKCHIVKTSRKYSAYNYGAQHDIVFCANCVQLPIKSLEALCIHELTHNLVWGHNKAFYDKLKELGGEESYYLDQNLWNEGKWPYILF